ncbi:MAG: hypothetical protein K9N21_08825 [Deltaproteobacteria bacterium]|nr:hypothetical protein [Deltaproteobacteria bacterium]
MKVLLYIIALLWIASGTFVVVFTQKARDFFKRIFLTEKVKRLSVLPFALGIALIAGAFWYTEIFWFAFILGLLGISKGVYFYMAPPDQSKALMDWWFFKARSETVRLMGLVLFVLGIALFSYLR